MTTRRIGRVLVLGASLLLLSPVGAVSAVDPGQPTASSEDEATDSEAVRFRQSFGLRDDLEFVRAARLDPLKYSSDAYGLPLSVAEVDELFRRARIQSAMDAAIERASNIQGYAGAYLDQQNRGRPVFLFTAPDSEIAPGLAAMLPEDADLQVEFAARSESELFALKGAVVSEHLGRTIEGGLVVRVGIDTRLNTLEVGVSGLTADIAERLRDEYGADIVVVEASIAESDACAGGSNNCRPIKGGLAMNVSGGDPGQCTSGFVVKRTDNSALAILTAGHCIQVHGGNNTAWYHNNNGFGRALYETWVPGGSGSADVGLTTIFSDDVALMANKNHVRRNNTSNPASVTAVASPVQGQLVCRVGVGISAYPGHTGHQCGQILVAVESNLSEVSGWSSMTVTHTTRVAFDSTGGDSGGPVFFYPGGGTCCSPVTAVGTHVHSEPDSSAVNEGWFSPYSQGRSAYSGLFPGGHTYNICLTASC